MSSNGLVIKWAWHQVDLSSNGLVIKWTCHQVDLSSNGIVIKRTCHQVHLSSNGLVIKWTRHQVHLSSNGLVMRCAVLRMRAELRTEGGPSLETGEEEGGTNADFEGLGKLDCTLEFVGVRINEPLLKFLAF